MAQRLDYTRPPETLARELDEVAEKSEDFAKALEQAAQYLPDDFPAEQLHDLLQQLKKLPGGTAEGCVQPLLYARSRLPAIRRNFILPEGAVSDTGDDERPPLTRGMSVDQKLGGLIVSVNTALDEYRHLASLAPFETADTAPSVPLDTQDPLIAKASANAERTARALEDGIDTLETIASPTSERADNLKRQMRDASILARVSAIELRMPNFVPDWLRKNGTTLLSYRTILRGAARAIDVTVDIGEACYKAWNSFEDALTNGLSKGMRTLANEFRTIADKGEGKTPSPPQADDADEPPADFDLNLVHDMILRGKAPPAAWVPWITKLDFWTRQSTPDFEQRKRFRALSDLSPLSSLSGLQELYLNNTQVSDLAPLSALSALQELYLANTQVSDLSPLSALSALERLDLSNTKVSDLGPLSALSALQGLGLDNTQVSDLGPLSGLSALQRLGLDNTQVSDLGPLSALSALQRLDLDSTPVSDLSPLSTSSALQILWLDGTPVSDLSPLSALSALQTLYLSGTPVSDLSPLSALSALQTLYLSGTPVSDLSPLSALNALQELGLSGTQVSDLLPLRALPNLTDVYVERGRVGPLAATLGRRGVVKLFPFKKYGFSRPTRRKPRVRKKPR